MKFQSQIKYSRNYLLSFARPDEVFSEDLENIYSGNDFNYTVKGERDIKNMSFHYKDNRLSIDIDFLKHVSDNNDTGGTLYLFGYQNEKAFKDMPKIKIGFRSSSGWCVYNLEHKISGRGVGFKFEPGSLHFSIPLSLLGNPDFIFYSLKSNVSGTQIDRWDCWRTINLKR